MGANGNGGLHPGSSVPSEFSKVWGWQVQVRLTLCLLWAHLSLSAQLAVFLAHPLAQMTARLEALEKQIALKK